MDWHNARMTKAWSFGPYRIVGELGRGAMGVVYRARRSGLDADLALKLLTNANPKQAARLRREAQSLARLNHPALVRVFDVGELQGVPYLAMGYVYGTTLEDRLQAGPLRPDMAAKITLGLAEGLAHAHAHQILHRDVKPANVLLCPDGSAKLVDFGLAKALDRVGATKALTQSGAMLGTPGFWSPELAGGEREVDARSDVYSLGATLFAALTGEPPFAGASLMELAVATCEQPAPAPSSLAPKVPPGLDAVVLQCLAKAPEDRYPTAAALAEDLGRFLDGLPTAASGGCEGGGTVARARASLGAGITAVVALSILTAGGTWAWSVRSAPPSAADRASTSPVPSEAPLSPARQLRARAASDPAAWRKLARLQDAEGDSSGALQSLVAGAKAGDAQAMLAVAERLSAKGNPAGAVPWFEAALGAGQADAAFPLALLKFEGRGTSPDAAAAAGLWRQAAEAGDTQAMVRLGRLHVSGEGVVRSEERARQWFRRAAEAREAQGMFRLARALERLRPQSSDAEALSLYRRAAESGHVVAMRVLAQRLRDANDSQWWEWLERAARGGNPKAMSSLGLALLSTEERERRDAKQGIEWLERASKRGEVTAPVELSSLLATGFSGVAADATASRRWLVRACALGHLESHDVLAGYLIRGVGGERDDVGAVELWAAASREGHRSSGMILGYIAAPRQRVAPALRAAGERIHKRAAEGVPAAHFALGLAYLFSQRMADSTREMIAAAEGGHHKGMAWAGIMLGTKDPAKSRRWLERAAEESDIPAAALTTLGKLMISGGQAKEGRAFLRRGALTGDAAAIHAYAEALYRGEGGAKDPAAARHWFRRAAGDSYPTSQRALGAFLSKGVGGPQDVDQAREWLSLAVRLGDANAGSMLRKLR
jgi:TPR repeat protein